jgi:hypothetical protein
MNLRLCIASLVCILSSMTHADVSRNISAQLVTPSLTRDTLITTSATNNKFLADVIVTAMRHDEPQNAPVVESVPSRIEWTLKDLSDPAQPIIGSGSHSFAIEIATHGNIMPGNFASANQTETLSFAPTVPLSLSPTTQLRLDMTLITQEEDNTDDTQGSDAFSPFQALAVSGNLLGGGITATFTQIVADSTLANAAVSGGENGQNVIVSFPANSASFPLNSALTFGANNALLFRSPSTGDLILTSTILTIPDFTGNTAGVAVNASGITFDSSGMLASSLLVSLPAGFGYATQEHSRLLESTISFSARKILPTGKPTSTTVSFALASDVWLVHEQCPVRTRSDSIKWKTTDGSFTGAGSQTYESARQQQWLASDLAANPPVLSDLTAADKASNEGFYRNTSGAETMKVVTSPTGVALLNTTITLSDTVNEFRSHIPLGATIRNQDATINVVDGEFDTTNFVYVEDKKVYQSYQRKSPDLAESCVDMPPPSAGSLTFVADSGRLYLTQDGGLRAEGHISGTDHFSWGGVHGNGLPTHSVSQLDDARFLMAGTILKGAAAPMIAGDARAAALLHSGVGKPGDSSFIERPDSTAYTLGEADYPGLNFRASTSVLLGRSMLAAQDTNSYVLKPLSKYYLRSGGVSGVHDAEVASFTTGISLYGYNTSLDGLRLSFLTSKNIESATGGTLALPAPSGFGLSFNKLTFTATGGLIRADLAANTGAKTLSYWGVGFTPSFMEFVQPKIPNCANQISYLTLGGPFQLNQISAQPIHGVLGFKPNGSLVTAADALANGVDSSLPAPALFPIKARGALTFPFTPATRIRFNNYDLALPANQAAGKGFLHLAGSMDVPFFEDLRVILHLTPNDFTAPLHVIGGYPSDPDQQNRGWTVANQTPFTSANFDANSIGYDSADATIEEFRQGKGRTYLPHVRKSWRKIVSFEFPMRWDATTRQFNPIPVDDLDLKVIKAQAQVKKLDASGAEVTFGAEFGGLPKINTESFSRCLTGAAIPGSIDAKLADALTNAIGSQINQQLKGGREAVDAMVDDSINSVLNAPLQAACESALNNVLNQALTPLFTDMQGAYDNAVAQGNRGMDGVLAFGLDAQNYSAEAGQIANELRDELITATSGATSLLSEIDGKLLDAEQGIDELLKICNPGQPHVAIPSLQPPSALDPQNISNPWLQALARSAIKELLGTDFVASANSAINTELNSLLGQLLYEARPTLREVTRVLLATREIIHELRGLVVGGNAAIQQIEARIQNIFANVSDFQLIVNQSIERMCRELSAARDEANSFFAENTPLVIQQRLQAQIIQSFRASGLTTQLQNLLRQVIEPVRTAYHQAMNLVFAQINYMVNEVALKLVTELKNEIIGIVNPVIDEIRNTLEAEFAKVANAAGDIAKKYNNAAGETAKVLQMAKIQGYVRTRGDTLDELRVDAEVGLSTPDAIKFQGFLLIKNFETPTPSENTAFPGEVATEITIGATAGVTFKKSDDPNVATPAPLKVRIEVKFSLDANSDIKGFDGMMDIESKFDLGGVSLTYVKLQIGVGGKQFYLAGTGRGSVWFVEVEANVLLGATTRVSVLKENYDKESFDSIIRPAMNANNADDQNERLNKAAVGLYVRVTGYASLNRLAGIPDTPLLSLKAGISSAMVAVWAPKDNGVNANLELYLGKREALKIAGTVLCLIKVEAEVGYFILASINTNGSVADMVTSFKGQGRAWLEVSVDLFITSLSARLDLLVSISVDPPDVSIDLDL